MCMGKAVCFELENYHTTIARAWQWFISRIAIYTSRNGDSTMVSQPWCTARRGARLYKVSCEPTLYMIQNDLISWLIIAAATLTSQRWTPPILRWYPNCWLHATRFTRVTMDYWLRLLPVCIRMLSHIVTRLCVQFDIWCDKSLKSWMMYVFFYSWDFSWWILTNVLIDTTTQLYFTTHSWRITIHPWYCSGSVGNVSWSTNWSTTQIIWYCKCTCYGKKAHCADYQTWILMDCIYRTQQPMFASE